MHRQADIACVSWLEQNKDTSLVRLPLTYSLVRLSKINSFPGLIQFFTYTMYLQVLENLTLVVSLYAVCYQPGQQLALGRWSTQYGHEQCWVSSLMFWKALGL